MGFDGLPLEYSAYDMHLLKVKKLNWLIVMKHFIIERLECSNNQLIFYYNRWLEHHYYEDLFLKSDWLEWFNPVIFYKLCCTTIAQSHVGIEKKCSSKTSLDY